MAAPEGSNWRYRRRFMFLVSLFCGVVIAYSLGWGEDTRKAETAITFGFLALMGIVGSYVFGATWDDKRPPSGK